MDDIRRRFATLDRVGVPDVWSDVERRLEALESQAPPRHVVSVRPVWRGSFARTSMGSAEGLDGRRSLWLLLAAALIAILLVGALSVGSGLVHLSTVVPPSPDPSVVISPSPPSSVVGSGSWTPTGNMVETRFGESATLLPNGDVLVAGGNPRFDRGGISLATAELYDPSTGRWTLTGDMQEARQDHAAVLLANGEVLVLGGNASAGASRLLGSVELYAPGTGAWTDTGRLTSVRTNATATLLADGKVLVTGGISSRTEGPERSAEVYDPVTGTWATTGAMRVGRNGHTATLLPDGRVLVVGGQCCTEAAVASAELYDPASGTWTSAGAPGSARRNHTAVALADGKVLVYGGDNGNSQSPAVTTAELYDPVTGVWVATGSPHGQGNLFEAVQPARLPNGRVLAVGLSGGELYDPTSGTWSVVGGLMSGGPIVHTSTLLADGRVLVTYEPAAVLFDPDGTP